MSVAVRDPRPAPRKEPAIPASAATGPQSVDRALDALDAVAASPHPVTAKALARHLGCALSTAYSVLGALTERGHLARSGGGFILGPRVPALHRAYQRHMEVGQDVRDLLGHVRRSTGAEAYLSTYRGGEVTVLDSTAPAVEGSDPFAVGRDRSAHATAHGKVLLAALPGAARRRYLAEHGMARMTERTITDPARFEREAERVHRDGVAVSVGEFDLGLTCVAVPLPGSGPGAGYAGTGPGAAAQALSVSLPTVAFKDRAPQLISTLGRAAERYAAQA
ncbi:IclR family transcriptional regulator C-terminal domain-containing protein [Streptomyces sp. ODS28]|uniref:IclR family transcriptional regulator n=1 Tax=Streptomyces sp. ODS28 TaxID=3136688 RepID=UPI0031EF7FF9